MLVFPNSQNLFCPFRYRHELFFHENKIWVLGGGTAFMCNDLASIPGFDVTSKKWVWQETFPDPDPAKIAALDPRADTAKGYPQSRRCHSAVHDGNRES